MKTLPVLLGCTLICGVRCSLVYGQIPTNGPALSAAMEGGSRIVLSWPKSATGFGLEYRLDFATNANWTLCPDSPGIEGEVAVVRLLATNAASFYRLRFVGTGLPPDPANVAPPLVPSMVTDIGSATSFLYSGTNAIQTGVTNGTIQARRAAAIRGVVRQSDGQSLPGVTISILNHVEYGQTLSRADGRFDLAVNGGGALAVKYEKSGFLPAQRTVAVPWQDFVEVPEVGLIAVDPVVTPVTLGSNAPLQVARSSIQTDSDGTRQATVLLPAAVGATLILPNGTTQTVASLNIRATEYTTGDQGPKAMPAQLPPTSAYTYCVELSADEAVAAGATTVEFDQPLPFYVENFLGMPVGIQVPTAYYDKARSVWTPTDDGRVIQVLDISNGLALLDVAGSGQAADAAALSALGITPAEQQKLAEMYPEGTSLWRVRVKHFTSYDHNYGVVPGTGAVPPSNGKPKGDALTDSNSSSHQNGYGSLELENQIFRESAPIVGTPFSLHYASDRVPGRNAAMRLDIPLSGTNVPGVLKRITLEVSVAGQTFTNNFPPQTNVVYTFVWDGRDAYGRKVNGAQPALVRVGYVYDGYYALPPSMGRTFGAASGERIPGDIPARQEAISWQEQRTMIGRWVANGVGLGGWTLSVHHTYDPNARILYYGDGRQRAAKNLNWNITTIAGTGVSGFSGDGGPATQAKVTSPCGANIAADGSVLIADSGNNRIRRIDLNGIIQTIAGGGTGGDNIPATQARLNSPLDVCPGPDGSVYLVENIGKVRRVRPDGIIESIGGTGQTGYSGDGGPATLAKFNRPQDVEVAPDGTVYVGDWLNNAVRRITADGIITTVAGTGMAGFSGDGGPAVKAKLNGASAVSLGPDGSLYIACNADRHIRRVTPDGIITTVAGDGSATYSGDGGPAIKAGINDPSGVAIAPNGDVFICLVASRCVRRVTPDGIISTFAGNGVNTFAGDDGPATQASLMHPDNICVGPDGAVYFPDYMGHRVRKIRQPLPGFGQGDILVPSEDGTELYHFDPNGRHLRTLYALTGAVLLRFDYDASGSLVGITDGDQNVTVIERAISGEPLAVVGPFGQRTVLSVSTNNYLVAVANPAAETNHFEYGVDGLLVRIIGNSGTVYQVEYDPAGRVRRLVDPLNAAMEIEREDFSDGHTIRQTTAEGRIRTYRVEQLRTGTQRQVLVDAGGTESQSLAASDGTITQQFPDGLQIRSVTGPDPQFGMLAPLNRTQTIQTPGGLMSTSTVQRIARFTSAGDPLSMVVITNRTTINGRVSFSVYDASNRTVRATSPAGRESVTEFDALGRVLRRQAGTLEPTYYRYATNGQLIETVTGTGETARANRFAYDAAGWLLATTNALGESVVCVHDAAGRLRQQLLPEGQVLAYDYDQEGRLSAISPPGQPVHRFGYTPTGLNATYLPPVTNGVPQASICSYNLDGDLTNSMWGEGTAIRHLYDSAGRRLRAESPDGVLQNTYDPASGNLVATTREGGVDLAFQRDGDLLLEERWSGAVTGAVSRAYDENFRIKSFTINGTTTIAYEFDPDSLVTRAGSLQLTRDPQNAAITGATLGNLSEQWAHNGFGEVTNHAVWFSGALLAEFSYERDKLGRLTQKSEAIDGVTTTWTYAYDTVGRLTRVSSNGIETAQYVYDSNGNRLIHRQPGGDTAAVYDEQDRLLQYGGTHYSYDVAGNLTNKFAGGMATACKYDALGALRRVSLADGQTLEHLLDGVQRRVGTKVNGASVEGFLYQDAQRPIAQLDASNQVVAVFVHAVRASLPDYVIKDGVDYRLVADQVGSVRLVVNAQTGVIAQRLDFAEFGTLLLDTQPGFQPFGFAGGLLEKASGLTHLGAREYDAEVGRWTTRDPARFIAGSANLYTYVLNSPLNAADPSGLGPGSSPPTGLLNPNGLIEQADGMLKQPIKSVMKDLLQPPKLGSQRVTQEDVDYWKSEVNRLQNQINDLVAGEASKSMRGQMVKMKNDMYSVKQQRWSGSLPTSTKIRDFGTADPNVFDPAVQYTIGLADPAATLELYDPAYKIQRLEQQKKMNMDLIDKYETDVHVYENLMRDLGL
jgi:RHS repeat-associated protein